MRKVLLLFCLAAILTLAGASVFKADSASAAETLLVCGVCDKTFYKTAERVVREMELTEKVTVKKSSCLGACSLPPVIEFRGELYVSMTEEKLKALLAKAYP